MANLAPKRQRYHPFTKAQIQSSPNDKYSLPQDKQAEPLTPPKRNHLSSVDDLATIKRQKVENGTSTLFSSSQCYRLDYLNSITYDEGKLYNLLTVHSEKYKNGKKIKCKCSKSRCESKYCECFSRGSICGVDCECTNCRNVTMAAFERPVKVEQKGCRCSKSNCLKNYCQCFQKGQHCGQKCNCTNCKNMGL